MLFPVAIRSRFSPYASSLAERTVPTVSRSPVARFDREKHSSNARPNERSEEWFGELFGNAHGSLGTTDGLDQWRASVAVDVAVASATVVTFDDTWVTTAATPARALESTATRFALAHSRAPGKRARVGRGPQAWRRTTTPDRFRTESCTARPLLVAPTRGYAG